MSTLEKRLEEQEALIKFLTSRYERDTGRKLPLPSTLGHLLGDPSILGSAKPVDVDELAAATDDDQNGALVTQRPRKVGQTMMEFIEQMNLPKPQPKGKEGKDAKKKGVSFAPELTLMKIDLSGFKGFGVSRSALKELADGIEGLPCLRSISLRHNGITDDCEREILTLFDHTKVKNIDLSHNCLKRTAASIGKKLRDEVSHIVWLDLTMNEFDNDVATHILIISGLKKQKDLFHVGLTTGKELLKENPLTAEKASRQVGKSTKQAGQKQSCATDQLVRLLVPKKPPTSFSLNMRNSSMNKNAMDYLCKALNHHEYSLTALNFKYCFLPFEFILQLADALRFTKSLIKLDLSNNAIKSCTAKYLVESLLINQSMATLNLHGNLLDDTFAGHLCELLAANPVLHTVDISQNPIGAIGAARILETLLQRNQTLCSLGDLSENEMMGVRTREEIKQALMLNNSSHDKKKAFMETKKADTRSKFVDGKDLEQPSEEQEKKVPASKQQTYPLLKPIAFSNQSDQDDYLASGVWHLRK